LETNRERMVADLNSRAKNPSPEPAATSALDPKSAPLLELESQLKANRLEIANREAEIRTSKAKSTNTRDG